MINDKKLKYLTSIDGVDYYQYKSRLFHYYYIPMAEYEQLLSHKIRQTINFISGSSVIYIAKNNKLLGYGVVSRGGGRMKFSTKKDIVLGPLWIQPDVRGEGVGSKLIRALTSELGYKYEKAYEYISDSNLPSINAAKRNGFIKIGNAKQYGLLHSVVYDPNGSIGIYKKE